MKAFFLVGPTASGKSEIAADVARECGAEIVGADAFQLYRKLDLLTAKPGAATLAKVPHHLIGTVSPQETVNAEKFRATALAAINEINARGKPALVVGGSGLYLKALTHGIAPLPSADANLREQLERLTTEQLNARLRELDPATAAVIDTKNRRRLVRALEVCLLTHRPISEQRDEWNRPRELCGVFVFRDREELHRRIDQRVHEMFAAGVIDEVRAAGELGATAAQTLGYREIRSLLAGQISEPECVLLIQQATRRYAKRQLTWFRRETIFEPLNLSSLNDHSHAVEVITQKARRLFCEPE